MRPSPFTFMARFSKVRAHVTPQYVTLLNLKPQTPNHRLTPHPDSRVMQIGNLDETESLMAQYLVDTTLTDVQFLTERPRCSAVDLTLHSQAFSPMIAATSWRRQLQLPARFTAAACERQPAATNSSR